MTRKLPATCLTPELLHLIADDDLQPLELLDIEEHLATCAQCRKLLDRVTLDIEWQEEVLPALKEPREHFLFRDAQITGEHQDATHEEQSTESVLRFLGPTDDPDKLGRIGGYEVIGIIGRGGMGVVFKAFDPPLNRFVAIKMLLPHLAASGPARKRFAREGKAAAAVIDDNVMPIFSVAEWQEVPYLVTQYCRGMTLQKRIYDQGPLELKEVLRIGMQTARGLAAAHAQGLVHRDVKPSNILLDGTVERALLTDFGLARAVDDASITRTGIIAGTPQYMSPEQARGRNVDARSDLFGLGGVVYTMCTGRPPFRAENSYAILRLIADEEPPPIREINPDIPAWLCGIIAKLMSKSPDDRFASAAEVAELLGACLAHVQQPTSVKLPAAAQAAKRKATVQNHFQVKLSDTRYWSVAALASAIILVSFFTRTRPPVTESQNASVDTAELATELPTEADLPDSELEWNASQPALNTARLTIENLKAELQDAPGDGFDSPRLPAQHPINHKADIHEPQTRKEGP